jgi:hypothetical protein
VVAALTLLPRSTVTTARTVGRGRGLGVAAVAVWTWSAVVALFDRVAAHVRAERRQV